MKNFLLSLFVLLNIIYWDLKDVRKSLAKNLSAYMKSLGNAFKNLVISLKNGIVNACISFWKFLKWITNPFRKATYEYVILAFFACLFISIKFPAWKWTDYTWLGFFFVLMLTLLIATIKDKSL
jgi:hypothetical protein